MVLEIKKASAEDIAKVAMLFDAYRVFYKQQSDLQAAFDFLEQRMAKGESVILLAMLKDEAV